MSVYPTLLWYTESSVVCGDPTFLWSTESSVVCGDDSMSVYPTFLWSTELWFVHDVGALHKLEFSNVYNLLYPL